MLISLGGIFYGRGKVRSTSQKNTGKVERDYGPSFKETWRTASMGTSAPWRILGKNGTLGLESTALGAEILFCHRGEGFEIDMGTASLSLGQRAIW